MVSFSMVSFPVQAMRVRAFIAIALGCVLADGVYASGAPDLQRGRALYENHCIACHGRQVHGRPGRTPPTADELTHIVERWQRAEGLRWSEDEIRDVAAYLARVVYGAVVTGTR